MAETMRTWHYSAIEGRLEDCLILKDDEPIPEVSALAKDELIVEVVSASLNPADYKVPETAYMGALLISRPATPSMDFAGRVVGKHPTVTSFVVGQLVFGGYPGITQKGVLRERIVISTANCAALPAGVDVDHAAAVGTAATTAYKSLLPGKLKPGAKVFVNGGSGGTGTWCIQFAKIFGAEVVTTCSARNAELCRSLGAEEVIDYTKEDVIANLKARGQVFDLVIDNIGSSTALYDNCSHYLKPSGAFTQLRPTILGYRPFYFIHMNNTANLFVRIGDWMKNKNAKAVIDSTFAFEDVPAAFQKLREGRARGKIIIHVGAGH
ncbi:Zinc-type alcohol dehydrogenase-like protein [Colletotrichum orbiculare MAFF 240422]|uniref:Zinc-type alcohol dehydrogenase-like protein n=1 Tax=Colletotrichum orbiculare (strain 104-T / ATCC 96160 / CBS 514.97 / LARS 414 / MAFF 240422) TaxID=1213857 RepID=A0A484G368_COLOR|nr:Zinc-type alcohol dehydrogenase-like protein [Colletotrichum orbiculare MAFF 240422]